MATIIANRAQSAAANQVVNPIEAEAAKRFDEAKKANLIVTGGTKTATPKAAPKADTKPEAKTEAPKAKATTTKAKAEPKAAPKAEAKPTEAKADTAPEVEMVAETPEEVAQRKAKELQTMLQRFDRLKELNFRRTRFIETLDLLTEADAKLKTEDQFETTSYGIDFMQGQYRNEKMFSIANRELILDFIQYLTQRIRDKVQAIEEQIIEV